MNAHNKKGGIIRNRSESSLEVPSLARRWRSLSYLFAIFFVANDMGR